MKKTITAFLLLTYLFTFTTPVFAIPDTILPAVSSVSTSVTPTSATISLVTSESAIVSTDYGRTTDYLDSVAPTSFNTTHSISIPNLTPNTTYHYMFYLQDTAGNRGTSVDYTFKTAATSEVVTTSVGTGSGYSSGGGGYTTPSVTTSNCPANMMCTVTTSVGVSTNSSAPVFTRNLSVGLKGGDVKALQIFLNTNGFSITSSGAGSLGQETEYFGPATKRALINFQKSMKIVPASGLLGPLTRAKISQMYGGSATVPSQAVSVKKASLQLGDQSVDVANLRTKLRNLGYFAPYGSTSNVPSSALSETSNFGTDTLAAVKKYQCDKSIVCTGTSVTTGWGTVGPKTRTSLGL